MSKVEELRAKYPKVTLAAFNYFKDSDDTPTKKYLDYMLRIWAEKKSTTVLTKQNIVDVVKNFDELLPYITNKDIYNQEYKSFSHLINTVNIAHEIREEKLFVKEDHIFVISETERYLFLYPKTFKGSVKYGANTKWCTTSNGQTFSRYKEGHLVYLIDKTKKINPNFNKLAFHINNDTGINYGYEIYNSIDHRVTGNQACLMGWSEEDLQNIDITYRYFVRRSRETKKARKNINEVIKFMKNFDIEKIKGSLETLKMPTDFSAEQINTTFKEFLTKLESASHQLD